MHPAATLLDTQRQERVLTKLERTVVVKDDDGHSVRACKLMPLIRSSSPQVFCFVNGLTLPPAGQENNQQDLGPCWWDEMTGTVRRHCGGTPSSILFSALFNINYAFYSDSLNKLR